MLLHPLTDFEMQKYFQNELKFDVVYSRNNFPKVKDGAYVINLDEYESIGTHWIALYANVNSRRGSCNAIYFDIFAVEHIPKEMYRKQKYRNKYL